MTSMTTGSFGCEGPLIDSPPTVVGRLAAVRRLPTKQKSSVFEVVGANGAAIVKIADSTRLERELIVYRQVLPALALPGPSVLDWEVQGNRATLVLEVVRGDHPDLQDPPARRALARWAARLHTASRELSSELPEPPAWLRRPEQQVTALADAFARRELEPEKEERLLQACQHLAAALPSVQSAAAALPTSFAHLDISAQNLVMSAAGMVALDWERSGWTSPAVDLAWIDLPTYAEECERLGEPISPEVLRRGALAGRVLADLLHDLEAKGFGSQKRYLRRMLRTAESLASGETR